MHPSPEMVPWRWVPVTCPEMVPLFAAPENDPSCAIVAAKFGVGLPGTLGCGTAKLNWPLLTVMVGWPGESHQLVFVASLFIPVMRIVLRYVPSNEVTGGGGPLACCTGGWLAQPESISIRTSEHRPVRDLAATTYFEAWLEWTVIFSFPWMVALVAFDL